MKLTSFVTAVVTTVLLTHCTQEETNQIIPTASVQDLEEVSSNKIYLSDEQRQRWQQALETISEANQADSLLNRYGKQVEIVHQSE